MFLDKIDVTEIISDHVDSLRVYGARKSSVGDLILFFAFPLSIAAACLFYGVALRPSAVNGLLTAFSIFTGLLFNLVMMVITFLQTTKGNPADQFLQVRKQLLREITANLGFSILLSLALVGVAIIALAGIVQEDDTTPWGATFLLISGSATFVLNLLMVLRRMYALLVNEFDRHKIDRAA